MIWGPGMGTAFLTGSQALLMLVQGPLLYETVKESNLLSHWLSTSHVKTLLYRVFPTRETHRI